MAHISDDLNNILKEMGKLRKAFLDLKVENAALCKQSEKQKQQLIKSKERCKKLIDLFTAKYKSMMETTGGLKSEVKYLRQVVDDLQSQLTNQTTDLKSKEDLYAKLEEEMEILKSQIELQADEHKKTIETLLERNRIERNREMTQYQTKLTEANAEIERLKERLNNQIEYKSKSQQRYSHPALNDSENEGTKGKSVIKRKRKYDYRWPNLNITTLIKNESPKSLENSSRKKKLFLVDNDTIVDLET